MTTSADTDTSAGWAGTLLLLLLAAVVGLGAGVYVTHRTERHRLTGTIKVFAPGDIKATATSCYLRGGYDDVAEGAPIVVSDSGGRVLRLGRLGAGVETEAATCAFPFTVAGLPRRGVYQVEVGHRGRVPYDRQELDARGWHVELVI